MRSKLDTLAVPEGVDSDENASEFLRFWVAHNEDHVSLRVGALQPRESEPEIWGSIIADMAKHVARALVQDEFDHGDLDVIVAKIETGFRDRLMQSPDLSGKLKGVLQ